MKLGRIVTFEKNEPIGWMHWCPGCEEHHAIYVEQPNPSTGARWSFDGNTDSPSFSPSVLCFIQPTNGERRTTCHYFIRNGVIEFCDDSPHKLRGQSVALPDMPEYPDVQPQEKSMSTKRKAKPKAAKAAARKPASSKRPVAAAPAAAPSAAAASPEAPVGVVTREGVKTSKVHEDGRSTTIHHATEEAAQEYADSANGGA